MRKAILLIAVLAVMLPAFGQDKQSVQVLALSSESHFQPLTAWKPARLSVISLVATKATLYRITCERTQRLGAWHGDCLPLIEGHIFKAEVDGNNMILSAENTGTGKHVTIKFKIADSQPAQFFSTHIASKESNSSHYEYTVPGYAVSNCGGFASGNATANSTGTTTTANAWGLGTANCSTVSADSHTVDYNVSGATLSLLLPDGRMVVVNCDSRPSPDGSNQQRSCRGPLTDDVQAEFDQDNARLVWSDSMDGSTMGVETYKILGILAKIPAPDKPKQ
ncbi:MAG: hypothetical protein WAN10_19100 [Candidatus Acidiferrales bacterium]